MAVKSPSESMYIANSNENFLSRCQLVCSLILQRGKVFAGLFLIHWLSCINHATAEVRVALVVGNSDYSVAPLRNPVNDATDVANLLSEKLGFDTTLVLDADQASMQRAIRDFSNKIKTADVRLFYFAGHGVSVSGENYMIPVGAEIANEDEVEWEAVRTSLVLNTLEKYNSGANVLILDACRDNPLPKSTRSGSRGLSELNAPIGSLILYATAPGQVAEDGIGRNGTFTKHLLRSLAAPDVHIGDVALDVRVAVMSETDNKQVPWAESSLTRRIYLAGQSNPPASTSISAESASIASNTVQPTSVSVIPGQSSNNYEASILGAYSSAAAAGDSIAQAQMGFIYDTGRNVKEDNARAASWYRLAVMQNQLDAMVNLAALYLNGEGVAVNKAKAVELLLNAADKGHPTAQRNLGVLYQFGEGVEQNYETARYWFEKAANQGHLDAFVDLGDVFSRGLGVSVDEKTAFTWYMKAALDGVADAQAEVGYSYDEGIGTTQNFEKAMEWFEKAANQGHPVGTHNLAEYYELGKVVPINIDKAKQLYQFAKQAGDTYASEALERLEGQ